MDRVLVIGLACICVCLLLTVILLIVHYEQERCKDHKKRRSKLIRSASGTNQDRTDPTESASLLGTERSPVDNSIPFEDNYYSTHSSEQTINADEIHEHYSAAGQLKSNSRLQSQSTFRYCLNKWCSCCCTNAPWQRELDHGDYHIAHQDTQSQGHGNDDIISIGDHEHSLMRSNTHSSPGSFPVPGTANLEADNASVYEFPDDATAGGETGSAEDQLGTSHLGSSVHQHEDTHFSDVSSIQHAISSKQSSNIFQSSTPILNPRQQSYQSSFSSHSTETNRQTSHHSRDRDLPPFPKPINTFRPPAPTPRGGSNEPMQYNAMTMMHGYPTSVERSHSHFAYPSRVILRQKSGQLSEQMPHSSAVNPRYNSLQPPSYRAHISNFNNAPDKRDSFYDNSLPRDSPLLNYYAQHNHRPELPGTRNLNQYY